MQQRSHRVGFWQIVGTFITLMFIIEILLLAVTGEGLGEYLSGETSFIQDIIVTKIGNMSVPVFWVSVITSIIVVSFILSSIFVQSMGYHKK